MIQINLLLLLLVVVVSLVTVVESMRFELESGIIKCITEDVNNDAMTVGKYTIVNPRESESESENENENDALPLPHTHKIDVKVTSPSGQVFHHGDSVDSGNFAFTTNEAGHYMICFWPANHQPPVTFSIDFDWKFGVAAKDWSKVAKKTQIQVMELELRKLYDTVTSIHQEMFYLRGREEEMQQLNRATNSKMATLSFLSLLVCLSVAGTQLWHLKAFFERKKLL